MPMPKKDMKKGLRCYVYGYSIHGDESSPVIDSRGTIIKGPSNGTVLIELDNPPNGLSKQFNVPVDCVYWAKQK